MQPAATAARSGRLAPLHERADRRDEDVVRTPTRSKTEFLRITSARTTSRPPSEAASSASRDADRAGQHGPHALRDQTLRDSRPV